MRVGGCRIASGFRQGMGWPPIHNRGPRRIPDIQAVAARAFSASKSSRY
jgi:hypothetical protein